MKRLILLLTFLAGCGESAMTEAVSSPLSDTEWFVAASGDVCGADVAFKGDGTYTWTNECAGSGYMARGTYVVDGDQVTTTATAATCRRDQIVPMLYDVFTVDGDRLHLSGGHGVMSFALVQQSGISPGLTLGCFEPGGSFVERAVAPL